MGNNERRAQIFQSLNTLGDYAEFLRSEVKLSGARSIEGKARQFVNVIDVDIVEFLAALDRAEASAREVIFDSSPIDSIDPAQFRRVVLAAYLRQPSLSAWLRFVVEVDPAAEVGDEDDDEDDDEVVDLPHLTDEELMAVAVEVAFSPGFGQLRNKDQRREHALQVLNADPSGIDYSYVISEVAAKADAYYESGVLPTLVQQLQAEGMSLAQVSDSLGLPVGRVKRAAVMTVPEWLQKLIDARRHRSVRGEAV